MSKPLKPWYYIFATMPDEAQVCWVKAFRDQPPIQMTFDRVDWSWRFIRDRKSVV